MEKLQQIIAKLKELKEQDYQFSIAFAKSFEKGLAKLISKHPRAMEGDKGNFILDTKDYFTFRFNEKFYNLIYVVNNEVSFSHSPVMEAKIPVKDQDEYLHFDPQGETLYGKNFNELINLSEVFEPLFGEQNKEYNHMVKKARTQANARVRQDDFIHYFILTMCEIERNLFDIWENIFCEYSSNSLDRTKRPGYYYTLKFKKGIALRFKGKYHNCIIYSLEDYRYFVGYSSDFDRLTANTPLDSDSYAWGLDAKYVKDDDPFHMHLKYKTELSIYNDLMDCADMLSVLSNILKHDLIGPLYYGKLTEIK